ncbi:hypothetical protein [Caballeronia sp. HLA56]
MNQSQETTPNDAALRAAIESAAAVLRFNNRPGSVARQATLSLFVAALSDRLALAFPQSAEALNAVVFSAPTGGNPTTASAQHPGLHE